MNKILLSAAVCCALALSVKAQTREINFKHDAPFKEVLAEAKKQNKLIFFDAYTSWCGPCKVMANTVFKTDSVADFFNQTFVNLKVDMEKGEGPKLKDRFDVAAYPTLLFIDGDGNLVHKIVGSAPVNEFMAESRKALHPENTVYGLEKKFNAGDHSEATSLAYMTALETAYEHTKMGEVAKVYFDALPQNTLLDSKNWELESRFLFDVSSKAFAYLYGKSDDLKAKYGAGKVDMYFNQVFGNTIGSLKKAYASNINLPAAKNRATAMEALLASSNSPSDQQQLTALHLAQFAGTNQWDQYCALINNTLKKAPAGQKPNSYSILWAGMEMVRSAPVKYSTTALKWADYYNEDKEDLFTQILASDLRKMASKKLGKTKEAEAFALNSENLRKQAAAQGKMTPPIMNN
ncbi:DUF255 domain-containing protein [Solitalea sp. MAHUQ-68]|uniref:DUF255 domain-containing protein n=1 Tax=Solitalea agri TaxID=2953739 RepID=A0A9X2F293_9SPHI|nr:DUF255 domain-containing protein [Solitalea agri]MCO4292845.1 DUF255 domain-containing protein [Solitalea agri]